jgi:hypothetical protein
VIKDELTDDAQRDKNPGMGVTSAEVAVLLGGDLLSAGLTAKDGPKAMVGSEIKAIAIIHRLASDMVHSRIHR